MATADLDISPIPPCPALLVGVFFNDPADFSQWRGGAEKGSAENVLGRRKVFLNPYYEPLVEQTEPPA